MNTGVFMKTSPILLSLFIAATLLGCDNDTEKKAVDAAQNANETMKDAAHEGSEKSHPTQPY